MMRCPETRFKSIHTVSKHLFFISIQHQFLQRKTAVKHRTGLFVHNVSIEIKLILLTAMILYRQVKSSSLQSRFNKDIFHLHRVGDSKFYRLPDTCRLITIKSMCYIFQDVVLHSNLSVFFFTFANRRIEEINSSTTAFRSTSIRPTGHFHYYQIFAGFQQFASINLYFTIHADMRTCQLSININLCYL